MGAATLWWGMLFGAIGVGYLVYARRQRAPVPLLCGLGLVVFPYFVSNAWVMVLVGAALVALPWMIRL